MAAQSRRVALTRRARRGLAGAGTPAAAAGSSIFLEWGECVGVKERVSESACDFLREREKGACV